MTEISVKMMWGLIAVMLLFIISVGAVGFVTLDRARSTLKRIGRSARGLQNRDWPVSSPYYSTAPVPEKTTF